MAQVLKPNSTITTGFVVLTGGATVHACLDETIAATDGDTSRVQAVGPTAFEVGLETGYEPSDLTAHAVKVSARYGGAMTSQGYLIELMEGATSIASLAVTLTSSYATYTLALTSGEAASITDYSNLSVKITIDPWVGGSCRTSTIEWVMASARAMTAATGTFALTGQAAGLTYTPGATSYTLTADAGAFTLTGQAAGLPVGRTVAASVGSFALSGQATVLSIGYAPMAAGVGAFTETGNAAGLAAARVMAASAGAFLLTGQAAGLVVPGRIEAAPGSFVLTGVAAGLASSRAIGAGIGAFTFTGSAAGLTLGTAYSPNLLAAPGAFLLTGGAVPMWHSFNPPRASQARGWNALAGSEAGDTGLELERAWNALAGSEAGGSAVAGSERGA